MNYLKFIGLGLIIIEIILFTINPFWILNPSYVPLVVGLIFYFEDKIKKINIWGMKAELKELTDNAQKLLKELKVLAIEQTKWALEGKQINYNINLSTQLNVQEENDRVVEVLKILKNMGHGPEKLLTVIEHWQLFRKIWDKTPPMEGTKNAGAFVDINMYNDIERIKNRLIKEVNISEKTLNDKFKI